MTGKATWRSGPWDHEPDEVTWTSVDPAALVLQEVPCLVKRNMGIGSLCGYVFLPNNHPWALVGFNQSSVDVHGGVSYARHADGLFVVGFDCAHAWDVVPGIVGSSFGDCVYRDIEFVRGQCEYLAQQARGAADAMLDEIERAVCAEKRDERLRRT